ncbi:MAG TPA: Uma2 family endonuclease [Phycisphaerales bacterium]|nr:Uma2 family endonuclease [Phycisphaerales bacterium]
MVVPTPSRQRAPRYSGLRMTADDYFALDDDGFRYELIDGVVVMTPSPSPGHQDIRAEIEHQLRLFVRARGLGLVLSEVDVRFDASLVYRPDLIFLRKGRYSKPLKRVEVSPDLIVEVASPSTVSLDQTTKLGDYQRFGVAEYWLVDASRHTIRFLRLVRGAYVEVQPSHGRFESEAVPGFALDLAAVLGVCSEYDDDE